MYQIGIDLVEIERIKKIMETTSFVTRFFGECEQAELQKRGFPPQSVAAAFAGKEAFSKAMGTGIKGFSLNEVEILHYDTGKPYLLLSSNAKSLAQGWSFDISLTHTESLAQAVVIAYREGSENSECIKC